MGPDIYFKINPTIKINLLNVDVQFLPELLADNDVRRVGECGAVEHDDGALLAVRRRLVEEHVLDRTRGSRPDGPVGGIGSGFAVSYLQV